MGIDNPLNLEVQAVCVKTPAQLEQEALYSKYQDFKCAGTDVDRNDTGAIGVGYMDLPANVGGAEGGGVGYMDLPAAGEAPAPAPVPAKRNASGKARPPRPGPPPG